MIITMIAVITRMVSGSSSEFDQSSLIPSNEGGSWAALVGFSVRLLSDCVSNGSNSTINPELRQ